MKRTTLNAGEPIKNLQHFLRHISYYYNTVPAVIPDGIFSEQTTEAVIGFQKTFNLPVNGVVDLETWNHIQLIYNQINEYEEESWTPQIFPNNNFSINPSETHNHLYTIQAMLYLLSTIFNNIGTLNINGTHDEPSVAVVKALQKQCGLTPSGIIDKKTFNMISSLYNSFISNNPVLPTE